MPHEKPTSDSIFKLQSLQNTFLNFLSGPLCSPVANGLKATIHLHIHREKEKKTKERKREISYILSRDINKMMCL